MNEEEASRGKREMRGERRVETTTFDSCCVAMIKLFSSSQRLHLPYKLSLYFDVQTFLNCSLSLSLSVHTTQK